ncbi:L-threonine ammonia-lyase [Desulfacinum hydrothermale DSM 13146]|uniref:L-threonine ammonia-lyase n=1 Tax=Desulfacinum hydrothermale DSM 13146 TaxID=1121390 RepID=A0A1W1XPL4_9BACT|nr:threonine ammonia-lyase [Desulfacinum hydrothermale]SMC25836.1 L-threonine ammonia-lyase [Desulfacinum hydrothermale DSM 13146]
MHVSVSQIQDAARVLKGRIIRTPLVFSPTLSRMFGADMYLKLENLQKTGSFKVRGATYKILKNRDRLGPHGVVAASAGNHAQGVALAARQAGVPAVIVMPVWASITKQIATRNYGAEVILHGTSLGESLEKAMALSREGRAFIHPFDDGDIMAGQGTLGLEILEELPDPDLVLVPVGGGGLIGGVATAVKAQRPQTQVIGVEAAVCPSASEALRTGKLVAVGGSQSIADGIAVKRLGERTFQVIRETVDRVATVDEEHIAEALLLLLERKKVLAEGAGAVPLGALLTGAVCCQKGQKVVLVISGGNVDSPLLGRVLTKGLLKSGRLMRFTVQVDDVPGSLSRLLSVVAAQGANVLHIYHDRNVPDLPLNVTRVELEVETRGFHHMEDLEKALKEAGYQLVP